MHSLMIQSLKRIGVVVLFSASVFVSGQASADAEPTLNQVYSAAQAGKLDEAQVMMQQVLIAHPNSAKAHFVRAELFARQGKLSLARDSLAEAERLAPGLPFAKPEAVRALRSELASGRSTVVPAGEVHAGTSVPPGTATSTWLLPLLLAAGVIGTAYFVFRRRAPVQVADAPQGLVPPVAYAGGYAQPAYGQPSGPGLGSQIMGGVATGLAVGAGVVAAEAIGRRLLGENEARAPADVATTHTYEPAFDANADMGGQNFGVADVSSWDDGSSAGAGDWDS